VVTASRESHQRSRCLEELASLSSARASTGSSTNAVNQDHSRGQLPPLPSYRRSGGPIQLSARRFVFCRGSCASDKVECRMRVGFSALGACARLYHGRRLDPPTATAMECLALCGRTRTIKGVGFAAPVRDRVNSTQVTTGTEGGSSLPSQTT
jgi:hypothetical protein